MVRPPLSPEERERGRRLGALLREARGTRPPAEVAAASGVSLEALRKIESGRVPTPAFFTVAALAHSVGLPLDRLVALLAEPVDGPAPTAMRHRGRPDAVGRDPRRWSGDSRSLPTPAGQTPTAREHLVADRAVPPVVRPARAAGAHP
ncbi:helix-turn-helix domain-containing protein [Blastococcus sp. BMG 814]|uniref:Helix-turn-helix domain-containing protein n=1 Tax=Blastococcus carthaginiensis TaxID=3050034 RepID=A0ABT9IAU6_9ACTN|nr:helix-turn-helix domain-containing protein [Blastococcus carthaginiensis]MDP5182702.1 helix-turn-helix domain-containing protein [Blastococcus carthaginiensis]